jgi:hypothetical protein
MTQLKEESWTNGIKHQHVSVWREGLQVAVGR